MTERRLTRRRFLRTAAVLGAGGGLALATPRTPGHADDVGTLVTPETDDTVGRGLALLARTQLPDGSFSDGSFRTGNVGVTALAGLALMAGGHQPGRGVFGRTVSRAVDYCLAQADGAIPGYLANATSQLSNTPMYQHGFGTLFLAEVLGMFPDPARQARVRDVLEKAVAIIVKSQNRVTTQPNLYGGWRYEPLKNNGDSDVSVTVAMMMALRAARNAGLYVDKSVIDAGVEYISGCQDTDGGFVYKKGQRQGTGFARSAAAVVGLYSAGVYDGPVVERGLNYLMQFLPGRRGPVVRPEYYYYGQYYAALAMWTAGGAFWTEWFPAIRDELLVKSRTGAGGMWADEGRGGGSSFAAACSCIILQLPNNYLPILQK